MPLRPTVYRQLDQRSAARGLPPRPATTTSQILLVILQLCGQVARGLWRLLVWLPPKAKLGLSIALVIFIGWHSLQSQHAAAEAADVSMQKAAQARQASQIAANIRHLLATDPQVETSVTIGLPGQPLQTIGSQSAFDGASTAKLLTAADYLHHVQLGSASLQHKLLGQTASYWLGIMLVDSDDNAWQILNDYLGHQDLADYASSIGFTDYDPQQNTFTAYDVARLLAQLYDGQLLAKPQRAIMLHYLAQANYRDYIVSALPTSDQVYHKIGMDGDNLHDAAIIGHNNQRLVLVIFTNGHQTYNWQARAQLMQAITKQATLGFTGMN